MPRLAQSVLLVLAFLVVFDAPSAQTVRQACEWSNRNGPFNEVMMLDSAGRVESRTTVDCVVLAIGAYPTLGAFDDKTGSIVIGGAAKALVCTEANFGGRCEIMEAPRTFMVPQRPGTRAAEAAVSALGNNTVSSIKVVARSTPNSELLGSQTPTTGETRGRLPLATGQGLARGERYYSASGDHYLTFQPDGNLVVYTSGDRFVWGLNSVTDRFSQVGRVDMQPDGNLAAYDANGGHVWSALTETPDPSARLIVSPSGALQIVSPSRGVLWASDGDLSSPVPPAEPAPPAEPVDPPAPPAPDIVVARNFPFTAGQTLGRGSTVDSPSGDHPSSFRTAATSS